MNDNTQDTERQDNLRMLRESAQSFAAKESPLARARGLRGTPTGFDRGFWGKLAEQGWTGLLIPESADGYGQGFGEMAAVVAALAAQVSPEPVVPALVFASRLIQHSGSGELHNGLLAKIAAGELIPAVAWQEDVTGRIINLGAANTAAQPAGDKGMKLGAHSAVDAGPCTLVVGSEGFTARLAQPLAQWLAGPQPAVLQVQLLRPALALPRLPAGAPFSVLAGTRAVGTGRVLEVRQPVDGEGAG